MTTLLLIIIYICFIGLGLPDSLFGTSWPAMYPEFHLPVSYANYATTINCLGTIVASLCSAHVIKKLGTGGVTVLSTGLTAAALLGIAFSENYIWICLFSIPLGLGAGAIDTALNNYVAMHYNATHMNFLHCFYGVGISLSPYLMSLALTDDAAWRDGYCMVFYVQTGITLVALIALPLWKRVKFADNTANTIAEITNETCTATDTTEKADVGGCSSNETDSLVHDTYNETNSLVHDTHTSFTNDDDIVVLSYKEMLKHPGIVTACFAFMGSCALEALCNIWGATYLVNANASNYCVIVFHRSRTYNIAVATKTNKFKSFYQEENMTNIKLNEQISFLRKQNHMTQEELALHGATKITLPHGGCIYAHSSSTAYAT